MRTAVAIVVVALLAASCATRRPAPVEERGIDAMPSAPTRALPVPAAPAASAAVAAPVPTYTVKRGDTLHQIALDTGLDYRELAAWNNIENPNVIRVGQILRLVAPGDTPAADATAEGPSTVTTAPLRAPQPVVESKPPAAAPAAPPATAAPPRVAATGNLKTSPKAVKEPYSDQAARELALAASAVPAPPEPPKQDPRSASPAAATPAPATPAPATPTPATPAAATPAPATAGDADRLDWAWPTKGKVIAGFSETANLKGIDIGGAAGQPVTASAAGRVVYAGSGLRGYGKLIIIKHNATFLSAYAHNREILVKEGQQVTRGQKIAEMGNTDADQVKLHFEIRRQGKPMDPAKYLPPI